MNTTEKMRKPDVDGFFDPITATISYVVSDPATNYAAIIDPVLDYDPKSGRTTTSSADNLINFVQKNELTVQWIIETHAHADHLTAAPYLKNELGGEIAIGSHIDDVQKPFKELFNAEDGLKTDGSQFDHLFTPKEEFKIGELTGRVIHTPGHTPACSTFIIGDAAFVGDTLFMPDFGTARCDFPGGDAGVLFDSIQKIFALPDETRMFMCHDYPPNERAPAWETTVADQKANNIHVKIGTSKNDFVNMRNERDAKLEMPVLILPSVQVNIRAGQMPPPEDNGTTYLKIPVDKL
jgi:glyoxylase-like metal-dependent hydrolase (beta-lactamase superfamily II)